jgi:hypothetical protein
MIPVRGRLAIAGTRLDDSIHSLPRAAKRELNSAMPSTAVKLSWGFPNRLDWSERNDAAVRCIDRCHGDTRIHEIS